MKIRELLIKPILFYQKNISPRKGSSCCKYLPSCSQYAIDALREWGVFCGLALAFYRILRCNPFSKGGFDPVPLKKDIAEKRKNRKIAKVGKDGKNTPSGDCGCEDMKENTKGND